METQYQAGDQVFVHENSYHASQARAGQQAPDGRSATILRQMPEAEDYEVEYDDGAPGAPFVDVHVLVSPADLAAGKAAAAEQAARVAAVAGAHAATAGTAWTEMAEAARLAVQAAEAAAKQQKPRGK